MAEEAVDQEEQELPEPPEQQESEAASPPDPWSSFRELPAFQGQSDDQIASRLYETLQQEQHLSRALAQYQAIVPAASEYLSNKDLYQEWLNSRNQQAQAPQRTVTAPQQAAMEASPWWNPPRVKDAYRQFLTRDENGREVISENAPLEARHELGAYQAYRADFASRFLDNPQATLGPMIESIVAQKAQEIASSQINGLREETLVEQIERENRDWLYDENGNVSREGLLAQKYIEDAKRHGISGAQARWDYATAMVERDLALANIAATQQMQAVPQQPPAAPVAPATEAAAVQSAQKNMEFLRAQAQRTQTRRAQPTTDARAPQKPMTFADRFRANLQQSNFSGE